MTSNTELTAARDAPSVAADPTPLLSSAAAVPRGGVAAAASSGEA